MQTLSAHNLGFDDDDEILSTKQLADNIKAQGIEKDFNQELVDLINKGAMSLDFIRNIQNFEKSSNETAKTFSIDENGNLLNSQKHSNFILEKIENYKEFSNEHKEFLEKSLDEFHAKIAKMV